MFASIRRYKTSDAGEVIRRASEGFVPIVSKAPGFIAYYLVDAGNGVGVSISVFETKAGADESNRMAATWVKANLAALITSPPEITEGETRMFKK